MITNFLLSARERRDFDDVLKSFRGTMPRRRFLRMARLWRLFRRYCRAYRLASLPATPETVLRYVLALRKVGYRGGAITSMLAPISRAHRESGFPSPTADQLVRQPLRALARIEKARSTPSMSPETFTTIMLRLGDPTQAKLNRRLRLRAMTALGWWGMLAPLDVGKLTMEQLTREHTRWTFHDVGYRRREIILDRGTDPRVCPIAALEAYLAAANIASGPLWRNITPVGDAFNAFPCSPTSVFPLFGFWLYQQSDLPNLPFNSLRNGALEAAFHAGVPYHELVRRGGFWNDRQLNIRLHQIVTLVPGDRVLPPLGKRAPAMKLHHLKKRLRRRDDI